MNNTKILVAGVVLLCMSAIAMPMVSAGTADEIGLPDYGKHPGLAIKDTIISADPVSSLLKTTWDVSHGNVPTAGPVHAAYWRFTFDTFDRSTEMLKSIPSASDLWNQRIKIPKYTPMPTNWGIKPIKMPEYKLPLIKPIKLPKPMSIEPIKVPIYQPPTIKPIKVPMYKLMPVFTPSYTPSYRMPSYSKPSSFGSLSRY